MLEDVIYCSRYNVECPYFHGYSKYLICTNTCDCSNKKIALHPSTKMMVRQSSARVTEDALKSGLLGFQEVLKRYAGEMQHSK